VFHPKFGEALVASNPMILLGWLTSKTQKSSLPISSSNPYCRQHLNTKKKKTSKKSKDEMKVKPKGNLT